MDSSKATFFILSKRIIRFLFYIKYQVTLMIINDFMQKFMLLINYKFAKYNFNL